jgi:hypothetical protein
MVTVTSVALRRTDRAGGRVQARARERHGIRVRRRRFTDRAILRHPAAALRTGLCQQQEN